MKYSNTARTLIVAVSGLACVACDPKTDGEAERRSANAERRPTEPDNSANNKGDTAAKTPLDQAENSADIRITADIRKAVLDDKSMSVNAQNVKIMTERGVVTLRGVVDSVAERAAIESKALAVAGVTRVDNQMEVK